MAGEWVVEGGGGRRGEGGLHSSNGMREPLSNRCRGGARSPRWLLRTLMSFSLDPLPPPLLPPAAPVRPTTHLTALASSSSTFDAAPRATRRRCRCRRWCSFSLLHPYSTASHDGHCPSLTRCFPFVLSGTEREAAMTRVNLPQTPGSIPTDLDFSLSLYLSLSLSLDAFSSASSFVVLPTTAIPPSSSSPSPFITSPVTAAHPATNLLRMLALYARLALNVWPAVSIGILSIETEEASNSIQMFSSLTNRDEILVV